MKIICSFKEVGELEPAVESTSAARKKLGRYSGGNLNVEGFGYKNWVVLAYVVPQKPIADYLKEGLTEQQIVDGCITFLNQPPTKRARKSKYGKLSCNSFYFLEDKISISLTIDQKNSKYFWGKGSSKHSIGENYSKRGRPAKGGSKK
tara:strand:+ start:1371 stop:1814 length:444 start_codon:yes stop_codon:yes gene_type:complete